ncbi:MAG: cyclic pyranopterin monophosphate synthase MoaC [Halarsenatibacteraceae bacterium]
MTDKKKKEFSHINQKGQVKMVDVSSKATTAREAVAAGVIEMEPATLELIKAGQIEKGAVLETARLAGIMAAKKTSDLIPLCHPLFISSVEIDFEIIEPKSIKIICRVKTSSQTGVEMEALQGVSSAALTIYDMVKAVDKTMEIGEIRLLEKRGGRSGEYIASEQLQGQVVAVSTSIEKGTKKKPLLEINLKEKHGIIEDAHAGDWHRQVSLLAEESIQKMLDSTDQDIRIGYGDFAENITTRGVDIGSLHPGDIITFQRGVKMEVTQIGKECHSGCAIAQQVGECVMPKEGIFTKVLKGGKIKPGDSYKVELVAND